VFQSISGPKISSKSIIEYEYTYNIVDTDFGAINVVMPPNEARYSSAIIRVYSERKLNVAANLVAYFQWYNKNYRYPLDIPMVAKNDPLFTPEIYSAVQKYLALI